jgi:hypothetical protein
MLDAKRFSFEMGNKNTSIFRIFNPCYLFNGSLSSIAEKENWKAAQHFKVWDEKIVWHIYPGILT